MVVSKLRSREATNILTAIEPALHRMVQKVSITIRAWSSMRTHNEKINQAE